MTEKLSRKGVRVPSDYEPDSLAAPAASSEALLVEIGTRDIQTIHPENSLAEAAEKMIAHEIGRLPVVSQDGSRTLLGLLTRREILLARNR